MHRSPLWCVEEGMRVPPAFIGALFLCGLAAPALAQTKVVGATASDTIVGQHVAQFVHSKIGTTVGRGECWDLAAEALTQAGAIWDGKYTWGALIDPEKEEVLPGDVVQFENVVFEWEENNSLYRENMPHHTAVVLEVKDRGVFRIAHQNFGPLGRKVGLTELVLAHKKKGKLMIYRPLR
ncbi:MAG: CHAP domain-containing protein [Flavobacteriales bacterium]